MGKVICEHACREWDFLIIRPGSFEFDSCSCSWPCGYCGGDDTITHIDPRNEADIPTCKLCRS